jgi:hypothetical protein
MVFRVSSEQGTFWEKSIEWMKGELVWGQSE